MDDRKARDGYSEWETGADTDDRLVPCVVHGMCTVYSEKHRLCAACVQEGTVPAPGVEVEEAPEARAERERIEGVVGAQIRLEVEREEFRREKIDFAISRGDEAGVRAAGGTEKAVAAARLVAEQSRGLGGGEQGTLPQGGGVALPGAEAAEVRPLRGVAVEAGGPALLPGELDQRQDSRHEDGPFGYLPVRPVQAPGRLEATGTITDSSLEDYIERMASGAR